jgi:hypothetical protein
LLGAVPQDLSGASVEVARASVRLPVRALPDPVEASQVVEAARRDWEEVRARDLPAARQRIALTRYQGAELAARMADSELPDELELPLSVVRLGACTWVHLPVELFASIGLEIRAGSTFAHTRVVGYTDEYFGYVCDEQAEKDGVYEALSSVFDAAAGLRLRDAALRLLEGNRG